MSNDVNPRPKSGFRRLLGVALIFVAGIAFAGLFNVGLEYTNRTEFCTSCHTMQTSLREYEQSKHYRNSLGVRAICTDCHVPEPFMAKMITKIVQTKDVWHELIGTIDTPEKFEARRWIMANRVWQTMRASDSRECRRCHVLANMDLGAQGREARAKHATATEKGQTCIDCHQGIVHREPEEPPQGSLPD